MATIVVGPLVLRCRRTVEGIVWVQRHRSGMRRRRPASGIAPKYRYGKSRGENSQRRFARQSRTTACERGSVRPTKLNYLQTNNDLQSPAPPRSGSTKAHRNVTIQPKLRAGQTNETSCPWRCRQKISCRRIGDVSVAPSVWHVGRYFGARTSISANDARAVAK